MVKDSDNTRFKSLPSKMDQGNEFLVKHPHIWSSMSAIISVSLLNFSSLRAVRFVRLALMAAATRDVPVRWLNKEVELQ